jgi:hypothetical protein
MKIIGANITGSFILNNQDVTTTIQTSNVWSGSVATDITALNAATASLLNYTASNNAAISDILLETASINTFTSSIDNRTSVIEGKYITTGSNTFIGAQYVSNTTQATTFTSTASLYTDGGLRIGKDAYVSGSAFIKGNLTVFGTSSIEYVTSSVFVGLEYIDLNTDLPALRYAGIRVYDSGSISGVTGSFLWDSQNNRWIYSNPSGSSYSGGMLISGPRASSLGSEEGTTNNALMKGQGGDHITSSAILDDGTSLRIPYLTIVNGTVGATTFSGSGANLTSIPNAALTNSTISGIALGSNLATLTIGTGLSGTSYNGSTGVTIACTITNNNQLTNGAGYITSAGNAATATTTTGNAGSVTYLPNRTDSAAYPILWGAAYSNTIGTIAYSCAAVTIQSSTGTVSATTFSGALTTAQNVVFSNGRKGLVGVYNPAQTQAVFAMGAAYVLTDGGASNNIGPLYGLGWSYNPDYAGAGNNPQSKAGLEHQLLHMQNGVTTTAIGSGIWTAGNITATGDITAYYSDMRLKTKISNIGNALDKVMKLNGFYYVNNDIAKEYGYTSDKVQIGVSAQEIEAVLPEIVTLAPFDATGADAENPLSKSGEHYKTVKYDKIVPLLIEAIKEQQTQIEELKTIINGLTK